MASAPPNEASRLWVIHLERAHRATHVAAQLVEEQCEASPHLAPAARHLERALVAMYDGFDRRSRSYWSHWSDRPRRSDRRAWSNWHDGCDGRDWFDWFDWRDWFDWCDRFHRPGWPDWPHWISWHCQQHIYYYATNCDSQLWDVSKRR